MGTKPLVAFLQCHREISSYTIIALPWWLRQERVCLQCRRLRFDPWVGEIPRRRECLPTPVFLPGKSHGQRSLVDYCPWSCKELDMTEWLSLSMLIITAAVSGPSECTLYTASFSAQHVYYLIQQTLKLSKLNIAHLPSVLMRTLRSQDILIKCRSFLGVLQPRTPDQLLNKRNVSSHGSGGYKFEIRAVSFWELWQRIFSLRLT